MNEILLHTNKFMLVLIRTAGVVMVAPMFGAAAVPMRIKAALALLLALLLSPMVPDAAPELGSLPACGLVVARELIVGLAMGFTAMLAFGTFQVAGEFIGRQMGLALGELADPLHNQQSSVFSNLYYVLAMLIFLAINGHHWFLQALRASFRTIPLGGPELSAAVTGGMVQRFVQVFVGGLKIAAPAVCVLLLVTVGLGLLARAAPLLNMLMLSIGVRIALGLVLMGMLMPYVFQFGVIVLGAMQRDLRLLIEAL